MTGGTAGPEPNTHHSPRPGRRRTPLTDEEILSTVRRHPERFTTLFDRYYDEFTAFFAGRVQDHTAVADLVAETLAAVLVSAPTFEPGRGSARQWLYGIARKKLYDYWRELRVSSAALEQCGMALPSAAYHERGYEQVDVQGDRRVLLAALRRLPVELRAAVQLRVVNELAYDDIAGMLGIRAGTARVRVHRGLRRLRSDLEGRWSDD